MPKRPREHQLETQSRIRFEAALPPQWVYRSKPTEYGIDGEVEVFDDDGSATGLHFLVQLKATDETELSKALARSIPTDRAAYYRSLSLPVLFVRYVADNHTLYTRWFHSHDSYGSKPGAKTMTFRWQLEDAWQDDRPAQLVEDARGFLDLRSATAELPVAFAMDFEPPAAWGLTKAELSIALRALAGRRPDVVDLSPTPPSTRGRFIVRDERIAIELARMPAATLHLTEDYDPGEDGKQVAHDLLALTALAFEITGQAGVAGRMAQSYLVGSGFAGDQAAALALSAAMWSARQVTEALRLADELDRSDDEDERETSFVFTLGALLHADTLTDDEIELYRTTMRERIARREAAGDDVEAGREYFNLASHYRSRSEPFEAIPLYEKALALDPEYSAYAHYWRELGGVQFLASRRAEQAAIYGSRESDPVAAMSDFDPAAGYVASAESYARALEAGGEARDEVLRADALLFAGHYEDGLRAFAAYNADEAPNALGYEWVLKEMVLREIVEVRGIREQQRTPARGETLGGAATAEALEEALEADVLAPLAWANIGLTGAVDEPERLATAFTAAAVLSEFDVESWGLALILFWSLERAELATAVLVTGERMSRASIMPFVLDIARAQPDPFPLEKFLSWIDETLAATAKSETAAVEIRGLAGSGQVEGVVLPRTGRALGAGSGIWRSAGAGAATRPKVGRNDPCPCGSGKKFKRCHGAASS